MTKIEITKAVLDEVGEIKSRKEAADLVEEVFSIIKESLVQNRKVLLSGFGKYDTHDKGERLGRNPATGAPMLIEARRVVRFKPSEHLKRLMNPHRANKKGDRAEEPVKQVKRLDAPVRKRAALKGGRFA